MKIDQVIQELWSGYGQILRIVLEGGDRQTLVAKHVAMPSERTHPRGWTSDLSHQRKVRSYQVETHWYRSWASRCDDCCRIPQFLSFADHEDSICLLLEDIDAAGYPSRLTTIGEPEIERCLEWLAEFHALFLGEAPDGLWKTGTYWHLTTRPDELDALDDLPLKAAAEAIDQKLSGARYQTLVHGDAKLANFCFSKSADRVAALDFQYVGGGCGMKDVAYFLGSCLDEEACEERIPALLDLYFAKLKKAIDPRTPETDSQAVIAEWRDLFPFAWVDFHRFLKGWCPGHWKINSYSERLSQQVLASF